MNIKLSSSTIRSSENRAKLMNLSFNPIVFFNGEGAWSFPTNHLKDISWKIVSEQIGEQTLDMEISADSPFEVSNNCNYIEFHLEKKNVSFQYDNYPCEIIFTATLDSPH